MFPGDLLVTSVSVYADHSKCLSFKKLFQKTYRAISYSYSVIFFHLLVLAPAAIKSLLKLDFILIVLSVCRKVLVQPEGCREPFKLSISQYDAGFCVFTDHCMKFKSYEEWVSCGGLCSCLSSFPFSLPRGECGTGGTLWARGTH